MTRTTKRRGLAAVVIAITLLAGLWFSAPALLRSYIARHYPGVTVSRVSIAWRGITLCGVHVEREGIAADLPEVFVSRDKAVTLHGGTIVVDYDALRKGSGASSARPNITGTLDEVRVKRSGVEARVEKVSIDRQSACFIRGQASHPLGAASVDGGCVALDRTSVSLQKVRASASALGKWVGPTEPVEAEGVFIALDASNASFKSLAYGKAYALSNVHLRRDGLRLSVTVDSARIDHPLVYPTAVTLKQLATSAEIPADAKLDATSLRALAAMFETQITGSAGAARVSVSPKNLSLVGDEECQTWVNAMPDEMRVGPLKHSFFTGRLALVVAARPSPTVEIASSCATSCSAFASLRTTFEYTAYDAKGSPFTRTSGPKSKEWVPLSAMSPSIPKAVMTLEDPGFRGHKGFIVGAIENSLKANLAADKFVRGGSTITMQLVKNLWLRRDKALARKAQEILLASAIEGCLSKDEIIELYLNVVEYGPDLYGIGPATRHYFAEVPAAIEPVQAFYLASILPAPRKASLPTPAALTRIEKLMRKLADKGALPDGMDVPEEGQTVDDGPIDTTGWKVNQ